jgi:hypothetical protein
MIMNTRKVLYTTTTDQHRRVLLKVVTLTRNVGGNLNPIGKTNTSDLSQG